MLLNIIVGFIIPWAISIALFPSKEILILITPASSVIALSINTVGFYTFWDLKPLLSREQSLSRLPVDLGLYPLLGSYLIYHIITGSLHPYALILMFTILTTIAELVAVRFQKVIYYNGWNGYCTFLSYLISYLLVYTYFLILRSTSLI